MTPKRPEPTRNARLATTIDQLRTKGATRIAFHPNGRLAEVEFPPLLAEAEAPELPAEINPTAQVIPFRGTREAVEFLNGQRKTFAEED